MKQYIFNIIIFIFVIIVLSVVNNALLLDFGDNILYLDAYNKCVNHNISISFYYYQYITGAHEPVYFSLTYIASKYITFSQFILILDIFFIYLLYFVFKSLFRNYKIIFSVTLITNFYIFAFLIELHKLVVGLIFLMLYVIFRNSKIRYSFLIISILSHLQITIIFMYKFIYDTFNKIKKLKNIFIIKKSTILLAIVFSLILIILHNPILDKLHYYLSIQIPYRVLVLSFLYILYLNVYKITETTKYFYPLAFLIIMLSSVISADRINFILMEFIFLTEFNRLLHRKYYASIVFLPLLVYNILHSIYYLNKVGVIN